MTAPRFRGGVFACGHAKNAVNATKDARPQCKICRHARARERYTVFKCGHPVTPENTRWNGEGKKYRRCRECDNHRAKLAQERYHERQRRTRTAQRPPCSAIELYRAEKARTTAKRAAAIAATQQEFAAALKRAEDNRKVGRPKKGVAGNLGRPKMDLYSDPADALIAALGSYSGAA
jgi:hypothetical protein